MKRHVVLLLSLLLGGCATSRIIPMVDIQGGPAAVGNPIPMKVAVVLPPEQSVYTKSNQYGGTDTIQSGQLLKKISAEIFPRLFSAAAFVGGQPYPPDAAAVVVPTIEDYSNQANEIALGFGMNFDATVTLKIAMTAPDGTPIWSRSAKATQVSRDVVSPIIPVDDMLGEATAKAALEAFRALANEIGSAREVADYAAGRGSTIASAAQARRAIQADLATAQSAQAQGEYTKALAAMRRALQADPGGAAVPVALQLLQALCDPETAKRLGDEAQKGAGRPAAPPTAPTASAPDAPACAAQQQNREGVALAREGKRTEALAKFQAARQTAPGLVPKASYNAALVLEQAGKPREAVAAYLEAYKGFLLPADQREALTHLVALAQREKLAVPETADRSYRLGIVRTEQKRYPEAATAFEAALAEAPWLVDAYYNLGLVYDFTGTYAAALEALRTYVTLAPTAPNLSPVKTKIVELEDKLGLVQ